MCYAGCDESADKSLSVMSESDGGVLFKEESESRKSDAQGNLMIRRMPSGPQGVVKKRSSSTSTKKCSLFLSGLSDLSESSGEGDRQNWLFKPQLFIQMELCRTKTLKDWPKLNVNVETRNRNHIMDIFYQIVCAVEYIHGKGLMHRDLKPSNVLFSLDETAVKIADFGLVTSTEDEDVQLRVFAFLWVKPKLYFLLMNSNDISILFQILIRYEYVEHDLDIFVNMF